MAAGSAALFLSPLPRSNSLRPPRFPSALPDALSTAVASAPVPAPFFSSRHFFRHAPPRFCSPAECGDASHSLLAEKPWAHSGGSSRAPTAPWMNQPLVLPPEDVLDLSRPARKKREGKPRGGSLTHTVRGGRSRQAMKKIVQSIARLGEKSPPDEDEEGGAVEGLLNFPLEQVLGCSEEEGGSPGGAMPWVGTEKPVVSPRAKKPKVVTAAELTLPEALLTRLRTEALKLTKWVKAKKAGVTDDVVDEIRASWRRNELVMVKFVEPLCRNMDRAREIVEIKTGGLVIWSKGNALVVFRGNIDHKSSDLVHTMPFSDGEQSSSSTPILEKSDDYFEMSSWRNNIISREVSSHAREEHYRHENRISEIINHDESTTGTLYEREVNRLLDGLGPRFLDWWWPKPLPVDADLLPEIVPGFKPPIRLCPPHVRPRLTDDELSYLRKLARPLPTHFALGKNSKLQGLAAAIMKLWEKSLIAKIAVKRGVPGTDDEQMVNELKASLNTYSSQVINIKLIMQRLTGGILILRNKYFIILYRGKDFIPPTVANSIFDRERELKNMQLQEEKARQKATETFSYGDGTVSITSSSGTFKEFRDFKSNCWHLRNGNWEDKVKMEADKEWLWKELGRQERKLQLLKLKIDKSEKELVKLNSKWRLSKQVSDQEFLTEEERQTFRRIGLKMDEFLLLGRRGVYDGTIASIHMHWKHREIVKVITMQQKFSQITFTASLLEIESGGILVTIEKLRRGHTIIIYRGKNYQAPIKLLPENLLTKKEAFERSIHIQRRGSLKYFSQRRQQSIWELKMKLVSMHILQDMATRRQNDTCALIVLILKDVRAWTE
ncbi:hypothetical protein Taro_015769 [Colocasia esculenta]|uniref:CRM domain-containing protein n=1 Tax=Colocasia esculenta TaxID=4460 RepID=A0A843UNB0_COLES|nr:hypothetical protein [Colocasia esculenta]